MAHQIISLAADAVVVIHFGWILFLIGGSLIGRHMRWVMWLHLSALGYSLLLQIFPWICPLTHLEFWLRNRSASGEAYSGSFIIHYLERIIYLEAPQEWIFLLTGLVVGISAWVYVTAPPPRARIGK